MQYEDAVLPRDTALMTRILVAELHLKHSKQETARAAKEHT